MDYFKKNTNLIMLLLIVVLVVLSVFIYSTPIGKPEAVAIDPGAIPQIKKVPIDIKKITAEEKNSIMEELLKPLPVQKQ